MDREMKNILIRIAVFFVYAVAAFSLIWFFLAGGEGTGDPAVIFGSWAIPLAKLIWPTLTGLIGFTVFYYGGLFLLTTNLAPKRNRRGFPFLVVSVHGIGCAIAFQLRKPRDSMFASMSGLIFFMASIIVIVYLYADWQLAKTRRKGPEISSLPGD